MGLAVPELSTLMPCDPIRFSLEPNEYLELFAKLKPLGFEHIEKFYNAYIGAGNYSGVRLEWIYYRDSIQSGELVVQCVKKPFYVTCSTINTRVKEAFEGYINEVRTQRSVCATAATT